MVFLYCAPPPPHAHVRLRLAREPASTELGSGERDACPLIRVCLCLGALSYVVASRGTHTYSFLFNCPRSLAVTGFCAFHYVAHFTVSRSPPRQGRKADTPATVPNKTLHNWGLDCRMIETSGFTNLTLPTAKDLATANIDSLTLDLATHSRPATYGLSPTGSLR
jgi:hypothetical protein